MTFVSLDLLRECGSSCNLEVVSVQSIERTVATLSGPPKSRLSLWQTQGFAAEMGYMNRSPELLCDPRKLLPQVKTVISFVVPYLQSIDNFLHEFPQIDAWVAQGEHLGYGRVARYAWGLDYHLIIRERLEAFVKELSSKLTKPVYSRVFVDAVPLLERSILATNPGFFIGHNSMLIRKKGGSYFFLAEILSDIECEEFGISENILTEPGTGCGCCERCLRSCPTKAISKGGILDARRCISYLTIEKKGTFSDWEKKSIGNWIFGCDECLDICPFNHAQLRMPRKGTGARMPSDKFTGNMSKFLPPFLELDGLLSIANEDDFRFAFAGTALIRLGRQGMIRNTLAIITNKRYFSSIGAVGRILDRTEPDNVVRCVRDALIGLLPEADGADRRAIEAILRRKNRCLELR